MYKFFIIISALFVIFFTDLFSYIFNLKNFPAPMTWIALPLGHRLPVRVYA
jgi:hypothetical protein